MASIIRTSIGKQFGRIAATCVTTIGLGLFALSGPASSQTVTPDSVDHLQHFLDCLGVLITNPEVHAAECAPSRPNGIDPFASPEPKCVVFDDVDAVTDDDCGPYDDSN